MGSFNYNDLFSMIKSSYGMRLSDAELEEVRNSVARIAELTDELRSVQLENKDEPMYWFKPYTREKQE